MITNNRMITTNRTNNRMINNNQMIANDQTNNRMITNDRMITTNRTYDRMTTTQLKHVTNINSYDKIMKKTCIKESNYIKSDRQSLQK